MISSIIKVKGHIAIRDTYTGEILREVDNLVVNAGLNWIRDVVTNLATVPASMGYIGAGSGSTPPSATDTDLESQLESKIACTPTEPANYQAKWSATFGAGVSPGDWYEAAIFNNSAPATGDMLCRAVFGLVTKGSLDSFTIDYTIAFADDGV